MLCLDSKDSCRVVPDFHSLGLQVLLYQFRRLTPQYPLELLQYWAIWHANDCNDCPFIGIMMEIHVLHIGERSLECKNLLVGSQIRL